MTDQDKIFRIAQSCLHCIANIACYRAGWNDHKTPPVLRNIEDFWIRVNGNFLDAATLNWCILFADEKDGKHDWKKAFKNKNGLNENFYSSLNTTEQDFKEGLLEIKNYRDKHLAHMDNPSPILYPKTGFMLDSASYLFRLLKSHKETKALLGGIYESAESHFEEKYEEALEIINT